MLTADVLFELKTAQGCCVETKTSAHASHSRRLVRRLSWTVWRWRGTRVAADPIDHLRR
ncbi:MAG: hypothetical protein ACKERG_04580 [Candidatus Hodgkinia cicadicola]